MKVKLVISGGYAGLLRECKLDTSQMPAELARQLEELVEAGGPLASARRLSESARDLQQYELEIEKGGHLISLTLDDSSIPAPLKPLIGFLKKLAKPARP